MFRLRGKRFHLIYSQCPLDADRIIEFFTNLPNNEVVRIRIGNESHQDGNPHRHVAIEFRRPWNRAGNTAERFFDIDEYHPQIKPKRTKPEWLGTWQYAAKDGQFHDWGEPGTGYDDDNTGGGVRRTEHIGDDLISAAEETTDYLEYLRTVGNTGANFPLSKEIWSAVKARRNDDRTIFDPENPGELEARISNFHLRSLRWPDDGWERRSLILQGPSYIGKTTWCKLYAPKPALWVRHADDLDKFNADVHRSIIVDDQCFQHRPRPDQLNWVDMQDPATVHIRYKRAKLPAGLPRIFTCNEGSDKLPVCYGMGDAAIDNRCKLIVFE